MADRECNHAFVQKIHDAIDYCRQEWDMTYSELVGCLEIVKSDMLDEMKDEAEDEDLNDNGDNEWDGKSK